MTPELLSAFDAAVAQVSCPECSGRLQLDADAEAEAQTYRQHVGGMPWIETVRRPAVVIFCVGCEYAMEVRPL